MSGPEVVTWVNLELKIDGNRMKIKEYALPGDIGQCYLGEKYRQGNKKILKK